MPKRRIRGATLLAAPLLCAAVTAQADEMKSVTTIGNNALRDIRGAAMVNQAAGDANLQSNTAVVALNPVGKAIGRALVVQRSDARETAAEADATFDAVALISGQAFSGAQGIVSVTQGAGRDNRQINMIAAGLGLEGEVVVEAVLSQSRSDVAPSEPVEPDGARAAIVTAGAFRDTQGIVQVNQVAGQANSTFNRFDLGVSASFAP